MMGVFKHKAYPYYQTAIIVVIVSFLFISISFNSFLNYIILWLLNLTGDFFLVAILYISFFSLCMTIHQYFRSKKLKEMFLQEKNIRPYYYLILFIFTGITIHMLSSIIFSNNGYHAFDFLHLFIVTVVALLTIYIPSLFIEMIENSKVLSFLYLFFFYTVIQSMLFFPLYIIIFISGV